MERHIEQFILSAKSKALATCGAQDINVVPVSSVKISEGKIWLIDYFMEKTRNNLIRNGQVALACWTDMMGYQIKGKASYNKEGRDFEEAKKWVKEILPDRTIKGLIIITPEEVYDISPTKNTKECFTL